MRILLFASTTGYQIREFDAAAAKLRIDLALATDRCHVLDDPWGDRAIAVRFEDPLASIDAVAARGPFNGIVAVGDRPACIAAQFAERLGLRFSPPDAVLAAGNKFLARERFQRAGLPTPSYKLLPPDHDPIDAAKSIRFPCVLKPLGLSASRGVIRANDAREFAAAAARIRKLVEHEASRSIQIEDFIPGREFALEGLITDGHLQAFALFDKPDPLDGPFFEETIYLTPSREPEAIQRQIVETAQQAVSALGLTDNPLHAEMRVNDRGVWMLEAAARPIGGICSRVLRFKSGAGLEEAILRHSLGEDLSRLHLAPGAHGVMMIPIPRAGVYASVSGLDQARGVEGIEDIAITAKQGQSLIPLPEGASYLGFIFARGTTPEWVERSLRSAHNLLHFEILEALPLI